MKFSQMKYERPDAEQLKAELNGLTEKLKAILRRKNCSWQRKS